MADTNDSIPIRVAVLEQMARTYRGGAHRHPQRAARPALRYPDAGSSLRSETRTQFHWLLGIIIVVLLAGSAVAARSAAQRRR